MNSENNILNLDLNSPLRSPHQQPSSIGSSSQTDHCAKCEKSFSDTKDQTLVFYQKHHKCTNRSIKFHSNCLQQLLSSCNCPKFKVQHDNNIEDPPVFRDAINTEQIHVDSEADSESEAPDTQQYTLSRARTYSSPSNSSTNSKKSIDNNWVDKKPLTTQSTSNIKSNHKSKKSKVSSHTNTDTLSTDTIPKKAAKHKTVSKIEKPDSESESQDDSDLFIKSLGTSIHSSSKSKNKNSNSSIKSPKLPSFNKSSKRR